MGFRSRKEKKEGEGIEGVNRGANVLPGANDTFDDEPIRPGNFMRMIALSTWDLHIHIRSTLVMDSSASPVSFLLSDSLICRPRRLPGLDTASIRAHRGIIRFFPPRVPELRIVSFVFCSSFFFPLSHAEITTVQFNMTDLGRNRVMSDIGARWMRPVNSAWSNEPGWVCDCELPSVRIGFSSFDSFSNAGLSKQG